MEKEKTYTIDGTYNSEDEVKLTETVIEKQVVSVREQERTVGEIKLMIQNCIDGIADLESQKDHWEEVLASNEKKIQDAIEPDIAEPIEVEEIKNK